MNDSPKRAFDAIAFMVCTLHCWPAWAAGVVRDAPLTPAAPQVATVAVTDTWSAKTSKGDAVEGCLAQFKSHEDAKEFIAYTKYDFICHLPPAEFLAVRISRNSCWEGDMSGIPCNIRPRNPLSSVSTAAVVSPLKPDTRAVPQLMAGMQAQPWYMQMAIAEELMEYVQVPAAKAEIMKALPQLRIQVAAVDAKNQQSRLQAAAASYLLLKLEPEHGDDLLWLNLVAAPLGNREPWWNEALAALSRHPQAGDVIVPALVDAFRMQPEEGKTDILKMLPAFGPSLQPYLPRIYDDLASMDYILTYPSVDDAMRSYQSFDWFAANHRDRNDAREAQRYGQMLAQERKKYEGQAHYSELFRPLWNHAVCAAFPAHDGVNIRRVMLESVTSRPIQAVDCD